MAAKRNSRSRRKQQQLPAEVQELERFIKSTRFAALVEGGADWDELVIKHTESILTALGPIVTPKDIATKEDFSRLIVQYSLAKAETRRE